MRNGDSGSKVTRPLETMAQTFHYTEEGMVWTRAPRERVMGTEGERPENERQDKQLGSQEGNSAAQAPGGAEVGQGAGGAGEAEGPMPPPPTDSSGLSTPALALGQGYSPGHPLSLSQAQGGARDSSQRPKLSSSHRGIFFFFLRYSLQNFFVSKILKKFFEASKLLLLLDLWVSIQAPGRQRSRTQRAGGCLA